MAVKDAPTSPLGSLSGQSGAWQGWAGFDPIELVPDLMWPTSILTYGRMRHWPSVTSSLQAYEQAICSASWAVDPQGANPDTVRIVADSLGLPVLGQPSNPGATRRRGVQWSDHLRLALLMLPFGHMAFEPVYELRDGRAYLAALPERMPVSILRINVDPQGDLQSIEQEPSPGMRGRARAVTIPRERLLWYAHRREGAAWWGQSILRAAYGPWLFAQDQMRVSATTQRRFGTPVPTAEALPGTSPTPAEVAAAQRAVSAIRVGDGAGIAMPPGFRLRLAGAEGTVPDGLPYLRYYDEQIARSMLASVLDLGNTNNGSRALGSTFLDILGLAMQGIATEAATTATELAVRLTDYNDGPDAPAPAVVVGDVSGDERLIAELVGSLVQQGALSQDPDLEAWVRSTLRLPEAAPRPVVSPGITVGGQPAGQPPTPPGQPVAAANERHGPDVAVLEDWPYRRPLSTVEAAAGVDPVAIDAEANRILGDLLVAWPSVQAAQREQLRDAIAAAIDSGNLAALGSLSLDVADAADIIGAAMVEASAAGAALMVEEANRQGIDVPSAEADAARVAELATALAVVMGLGVTSAAAREALRVAGDGRPGTEVADQVVTFLAGMSDRYPSDMLGGAVNTGLNAGRAAVLAAAPAATYYHSAIRDKAVCAACAANDGHQYADLPSAEADFPTGGYALCLGRERCRCVIATVWSDVPAVSAGPVRVAAAYGTADSLANRPPAAVRDQPRIRLGRD